MPPVKKYAMNLLLLPTDTIRNRKYPTLTTLARRSNQALATGCQSLTIWTPEWNETCRGQEFRFDNFRKVVKSGSNLGSLPHSTIPFFRLGFGFSGGCP